MKYKTGLWKKVSEQGTHYCSGKVKIGTTDFKVVLFKNEKKNEKSPDFNLILEDSVNVLEDKKSPEMVLKNEPNNGLDDSLFEEFGNSIEIDPDEIPF